MRPLYAHALVAAALMALASAADAACLTDEQVSTIVDSYLAKKPAPNPEGLSDADGACSRAKFNVQFAPKAGGPVVGYKAGLTNPAVQKRFNATAPVWGVLYAPMLLKDGASVEAGFGARPLFEADLLVRIADDTINQAKTPEQAIQAIESIIPTIELPDLTVEAPPKLNGAAIAAINVGARYFVLGTPIPARGKGDVLDALPGMRVVVKGGGGEDLDVGFGRDVLEHPLNAVIWLAQDLQKQGLALKKGDLVSVGSFSKLLPPKPGKVEVQYHGLPGNPTVTVLFR